MEALNRLRMAQHPRSAPPNQVWETMTRVVLPGQIVRVWRGEPTMKAMLEKIAGDPEVRATVEANSFSPASILINVGGMSRVAAIEILDAKTGCGALFYPDWK